MNGVLRRMAPLIEAAAGDRIQAAIRPSPGAGKVRADAAQLESAILNLVSHACNVMAGSGPGLSNQTGAAALNKTGQLLIDTARVDLPHGGRAASYVLLSVTYSAAEPDIERLFDPSSTDGSSLAMAQVHWLAAKSGGYVSARSGPNGGSRIELLLPRPGRPSPAFRRQQPGSHHSSWSSPAKPCSWNCTTTLKPRATT